MMQMVRPALGGIIGVSTSSITSLDAVDYSCTTTLNLSSVSDSPITGWGIFICINSNTYRWQKVMNLTTGVTYERTFEGTTGVWVRTDNFGCSTLAELKAALAAV